MDFEEFTQRFGGSARTKNILRAAEDRGGGRSGPAKPDWKLPPVSGLPAEFIRLCPWEIEFLYLVARRARVGIIEIGRFNGGSTFLLACAGPTVPIHSIDVAPRNDALLAGLFSRHGIGANVGLIVGDSQAASYPEVGPADLLFIDGDHSYAGCLADIRNWYGNLVEGGMIVLHDSYLHPDYGVQDAVLDFLAERRDELDIVLSPLIGPHPWRHPFGSMACLRKKGR